MAISKGSSIGREACSFMLAVEQYDAQNMRGIVYAGNQEQGVCCHSFAELAIQMERGFEEMNYPTPSVQKRNFSPGRTAGADVQPVEDRAVLHRQKGSKGTFRIRVRQCLYATWQGQVKLDEEEGEEVLFESFLELIQILDGALTGARTLAAAELPEEGTALTDSLRDALLLGGRYDGIWIGEQEPSEVLVCGRNQEDGGKETFVVRPMFRENHTLQGTLYWSGGRQKKNFRSFLEFLFLILSATGSLGVKEEDP